MLFCSKGSRKRVRRESAEIWESVPAAAHKVKKNCLLLTWVKAARAKMNTLKIEAGTKFPVSLAERHAG